MIPVEAVIARFLGQGCLHREDRDFPSSLAFESPDGMVFTIPRPIEADGGYSVEQLTRIENRIQAFGIDLFPLDMHQVA